jgi:hypothetical protein
MNASRPPVNDVDDEARRVSRSKNQEANMAGFDKRRFAPVPAARAIGPVVTSERSGSPS